MQTGGTKQSSYVMSDQQANTRTVVDDAAFEKIVASPSNMLKNPVFANGLDSWRKRVETSDEGAVVDADGKKAFHLKITKDDKKWYGVYQNIDVPRGSYIYLAKLKSKNKTVRIPRLSHYKRGGKQQSNTAFKNTFRHQRFIPFEIILLY